MSPKTVYCKDKSRVHFLTQNLLELIFRLGVGNVCFGFTQGCKLVKQDFHEKPIFFAPFLKWLLLCCSKIRKMLKVESAAVNMISCQMTTTQVVEIINASVSSEYLSFNSFLLPALLVLSVRPVSNFGIGMSNFPAAAVKIRR